MTELEIYRCIVPVLAVLLCLAWGSRCYWYGNGEDSGWENEALWWREREMENRESRESRNQ